MVKYIYVGSQRVAMRLGAGTTALLMKRVSLTGPAVPLGVTVCGVVSHNQRIAGRCSSRPFQVARPVRVSTSERRPIRINRVKLSG